MVDALDEFPAPESSDERVRFGSFRLGNLLGNIRFRNLFGDVRSGIRESRGCGFGGGLWRQTPTPQ
jgi:hypothetical protein